MGGFIHDLEKGYIRTILDKSLLAVNKTLYMYKLRKQQIYT